MTLSTALGFLENLTALTTFEQSPTQHCFYDDTQFFQPNHQKAHGPSTSENLFNSNNMHVNIVYWISLHPKRQFYLLFLGQTPPWDKGKAKKQNLQPTPSESWDCCGNFKPKSWGPKYTKSGAIIFPMC